MKNSSSTLPIPERGEEEKQERKQFTQSLDGDEEEKARCEWDFSLSAVVSSSSSSPTAAACDAIGVIEFDPTGQFLATGGIARRIRIYSVQKSLNSRDDNGQRGVNFIDHAIACEFYMCTPAKLSSLKWRPGSGSRVIGSGDYDGVVMEYDLEKRVPVFERDEHGGRRVWSMDYSHWDPNLGASGSDDGTMQMWDPRCDDGGKCLGYVQPNRVGRSPVCCVEFNPFGGPLVAVGCADRRIYGYDPRRLVDPVFVFDGHQKAVTYTKFLDFQTLISSSIDGCLMMWNTEDKSPIRTYKGHVNSRRFMGLSVWGNGGLLSCGSENNQVFVYDKRWGQPIWVTGLEPVTQVPRCEPGFVSSVCWRQTGSEPCMLVAGGSDGVLQAFEGKRK
ncbi:WD repeat-containing protein rup2 [Castilleja foliolosa]|uniref:WD repeat-containing protein rup2 n=1 Tax=Castilleja foliolosa TaxID=1961234 RepID=A0ABD3EJS9_9LAMI